MSLYDYRKQIQKLYNEPKSNGDIYEELSELRIDDEYNKYIKTISTNIINKSITFDLVDSVSDKQSQKLINEIRRVITEFINKNIHDQSDEFKKFVESDLCYDEFILCNDNGIYTIIVQL